MSKAVDIDILKWMKEFSDGVSDHFDQQFEELGIVGNHVSFTFSRSIQYPKAVKKCFSDVLTHDELNELISLKLDGFAKGMIGTSTVLSTHDKKTNEMQDMISLIFVKTDNVFDEVIRNLDNLELMLKLYKMIVSHEIGHTIASMNERKMSYPELKKYIEEKDKEQLIRQKELINLDGPEFFRAYNTLLPNEIEANRLGGVDTEEFIELYNFIHRSNNIKWRVERLD